MTDVFETIPFTRIAQGAEEATARREAELSGYAAGYAEGARRAERMLAERRSALDASAERERRAEHAVLAERAERLDRVAAALDARLEPVLREARATLLNTAVELAEALLGRELADGESSARAIAHRVLTADEDRATTRLRVHPAEAPAVAALLEGHPLEVVADAVLARGDAVAELPAGFLDARITSALARVRRALSEGTDEGAGA